MRVLFDAHHLGRHQTGNETYVSGLVGALRDAPDLELTVAVDSGVPRSGVLAAPLAVRRLPPAAPVRLLALALSARLAHVDVLHSIYYLPPLAPRPVVVSIHDVSYERFPQFFSRRERVKDRLAVAHAARHSDAVVTLTEHSRSEIISVYGVDPSRVHVVPAGVRPLFLEAGQGRASADRGDGALRVLAVGTLQPRKNLLRLLEALRVVARRHPVSLRVVGPDGFQATRIRELAADAPFAIEIAGYVDDDALLRAYMDADVLAYPSIYEGFGLPVVEAMACGTPVVTSTAGALAEVAGDAALFVDPYDVESIASALLRLAEDPSLRTELSRRGRERAQAYTWAKSADRLLAVYRLLGRRRA